MYFKHGAVEGTLQDRAVTSGKGDSASKKADKFAIINLGGSQVKVMVGDTVVTHRMYDRDGRMLQAGEEVHLKEVLMVGSQAYTMVGAPFVENAKVVVAVEQQTKGDKVMVFKMKRRKGYERTHGESPCITEIRVIDIQV
jgi:large subunit ribosomal protein L21